MVYLNIYSYHYFSLMHTIALVPLILFSSYDQQHLNNLNNRSFFNLNISFRTLVAKRFNIIGDAARAFQTQYNRIKKKCRNINLHSLPSE